LFNPGWRISRSSRGSAKYVIDKALPRKQKFNKDWNKKRIWLYFSGKR